jgi:hypothetical protein
MVRKKREKQNEFNRNIIGGGGDLTASPKYNSRGYNKEVKQYRGNANREQRGAGNSRYRNSEQNNAYRVR